MPNIIQGVSLSGINFIDLRSIITSGLVIHLDAGNTASYPGSGSTWYDISGNSNNLDFTGLTMTTGSSGYLTVSGSTARSIANSASLRNNTVTASCWFYLNSTSSNPVLLEQWYPNDGWMLGVLTSSSKLFVNFATSITGALQKYGSTVLQTSTWYNAAFTYDGSTAAIYLNGVLENSWAQTGTINNVSTQAIYVGSNAVNGFINSRFAQVAVYNTALSNFQLTHNFNIIRGRYGV